MYVLHRSFVPYVIQYVNLNSAGFFISQRNNFLIVFNPSEAEDNVGEQMFALQYGKYEEICLM